EDVKAMKEMLEACASAGTTLIIFTKLLLAHLWVELLESCTQPRWWVDPNPLCVIRHPSRARGGYKNKVMMRSVVEMALVCVARDENGLTPEDHRELDEVSRLWPPNTELSAVEYSTRPMSSLVLDHPLASKDSKGATANHCARRRRSHLC